jgi:hypothetical protein
MSQENVEVVRSVYTTPIRFERQSGEETESHGLRMGAAFQACTGPTARKEPVQVA